MKQLLKLGEKKKGDFMYRITETNCDSFIFNQPQRKC